MKILVAAACVAIISGVGYWAWTEHQEGQRRARIAEFEQDRSFCLEMVGRHLQGGSNDTQVLSEDCVNRGLVSLEDIDRLRR